MYRMAGYCRLSKEDGENRISESIENQMRLISEYVDKAGDMKLVRMYIDDGYSGLYFSNRPQFQQMMADIYQTDILIPNYLEEATSIGAAILGGIGVGLFKDFSVTERFIHTVGVVHPDERNRKRYQEWMQVFDRAYWALEDLYAEMAKFNNQMNR